MLKNSERSAHSFCKSVALGNGQREQPTTRLEAQRNNSSILGVSVSGHNCSLGQKITLEPGCGTRIRGAEIAIGETGIGVPGSEPTVGRRLPIGPGTKSR